MTLSEIGCLFLFFPDTKRQDQFHLKFPIRFPACFTEDVFRYFVLIKVCI